MKTKDEKKQIEIKIEGKLKTALILLKEKLEREGVDIKGKTLQVLEDKILIK